MDSPNTPKKVSRWTEVKPDGTPKHKEGDLFWVDAAEDCHIRVVRRCTKCGTGTLVPWMKEQPAEVCCLRCRSACK